MDKNTLISSFGKWVSPINFKKIFEHVENGKQDYYIKKLTTEAFIKLLLFAQLHETESLQAMSDALLNVFDRGYVDYERFNRMTDDGYFFVSRLKKNAVIREIERFTLPEGSKVLADKMVYIGTPQKRAENIFRLLEVIDTKGNNLRLITNRFDLSAEEISEIYRSRWTIELFF
ncbi:hypothetical protein U473_11320 [Tepidibacillus decaturensis]|uniref:DUF4372 domain-containing protein n=1 Tax=Tepidibacillus decaturensis TaxID=1413211 RepID=A0A135L6E1_9BACI|nr:hypothetical protein U473_11320 [Tepidibacillus decaturensis]